MKPNEKKTKGDIIAAAITSRDFDIPDYMYDLIDDYVVESVMNKYDKESCLTMFLTNSGFRSFCEYVIDIVSLRKEFFLEIIRTHRLWEGLYIFSESDWALLETYSFSVKIQGDTIEEINGAPGVDEEFPFTFDDVMDTIHTVLMNPELLDQFEGVFRFAYMKLDEFIDEFKEKVPTRYLVSAITLLGAQDNYAKTYTCIEHGMPILYHDYDCVDLYIYLQTVIDTKYLGELDPALCNIGAFVKDNHDTLMSDEVLDMLWYIGATLNQNNLKYYYLALGKPETDIMKLMTIMETMNGHMIAKWCYMKNFKDLISILGHRSSGYSIDLQKFFLANDGDIKTMFDETGHLLTEASIIQTTDMIPFLFQVINDEDLKFLLHTSVEFVKNLMTSTWVNRDHLLRVLGVLFEFPVNEDLWKLINNPSLDAEFTDYRATIVNKAVITLSKEAIISSLPKAVAYIEPTIPFVSRNMTAEYIRYFPVTKIAPMLKGIIGRYGYVQFNLFCNGKTVSIAKAIGDTQFIIDTLIRNKRYGYLCDMEGEDVEKIIDTIVEHMEIGETHESYIFRH